MIIVGITGQIASGKTTLSNIIEKMGYKVFDADKVNKKILQKKDIRFSLKKEFQHKIKGLFSQNGELNKRRLMEHVFSDEKELEKLEKITHPQIYKEELNFVKKSSLLKRKMIFLDLPLLFKNLNYQRCDFIIYLSVNKIIQNQRLLKRKNVHSKIFKKIIDRQHFNKLKFEKYVSVRINTGIGLLEVIKKIKHFFEIIKIKRTRKKWPIIYNIKIK